MAKARGRVSSAPTTTQSARRERGLASRAARVPIRDGSGGAEIELLTHVADRVRYIEGNLFWDVTPEVRVGAACIYTTVTYLDGESPHNIRTKATAHYFF